MDVSVISVTFSNSGPVIDGSLDLVRKIESRKGNFSLDIEKWIFSFLFLFLILESGKKNFFLYSRETRQCSTERNSNGKMSSSKSRISRGEREFCLQNLDNREHLEKWTFNSPARDRKKWTISSRDFLEIENLVNACAKYICRVHGLNQHTVKINGLSFAKWLFLGLMYECPLQRCGSFVLNFQWNSQWTPASWSLISRRQPLSDRKPHGRESLAHLSENHLSISIQRSGGAGFIPPVLEGDIQCLQILFHRLKTPLFLRRNILLFPVLLFGFGKVCVMLPRRESI